MIKTPAHKQTDPNKAPGQIVFSPVAPNTYGFDRHPYLKSNNSDPDSDKGDRTLSDYIKRINDRSNMNTTEKAINALEDIAGKAELAAAIWDKKAPADGFLLIARLAREYMDSLRKSM